MFRKRTPQERFWEILPGLQFWVVFFGSIWLSYYLPVWAALFIICFDLYWVLKAINTAIHLIASYNKFKLCVTINWLDYDNKLNNFSAFADYLSGQDKLEKTMTAKSFFQGRIQKNNRLNKIG